ncbi:hypothetical protein [Blastomonas sp.]|uniref:hypothetical protein n=1 Tax=Blastomonas sp. TaxID=1909299 RepID=UPI003593C6F1
MSISPNDVEWALRIGGLAGSAAADSTMTHEIADRFQSFVDSEVCNSDSWDNGVPPNVEITLAEAEDIAKSLRRVANLLDRIGGAA